MTAPFLGSFAEGKELPPDDFLDDYEDFFRAYRAGFLFWLREKATGSEEESRTKFAELVATQARRKIGVPLSDVAQAVYGLPLSDQSGAVDNLEWRYLAWLAKGR